VPAPDDLIGKHGNVRSGIQPGSFDPPTLAHLAIADAARRRWNLDSVVWALSRDPLGKQQGGRTTVEARRAVLDSVADDHAWLEVEVSGPRDEVLPALRKIKGVSDVTIRAGQGRSIYTIQAQGGEDLRDQISRAVISSGWSLLSMQMVGMSLEEIFLKLTTHEEL